MPPTSLGELQQLAMLAVARLGDDAYGGVIRDEIERITGRKLTVSTIYVTLVRLENDGLVTSLREDNLSGRGGKPRRYFMLAPQAWEALRASRNAMDRMWHGLEPSQIP